MGIDYKIYPAQFKNQYLKNDIDEKALRTVEQWEEWARLKEKKFNNRVEIKTRLIHDWISFTDSHVNITVKKVG
jgi:hypothetical protein